MRKETLLLAALLGFFLVLSTAPSQTWLDSSELIAGANLLGISHPPGQPLYSMLSKAFTLLPLGSIPFRVNLFSGFMLILSFLAAGALLDFLFGDGSRRVYFISAAAACFLFLTYSYMFQGVRAEVYSLNFLLSCLVLLFFLKKDLRIAGFFIFGLSFGCHPLLTAGLLPAIIIITAGRKVIPGRLLLGAGAFAAGVSVYIYLPVRAAAGPAYNFGSPYNLANFLWTVTCKLYKAYDTIDIGIYAANIKSISSLFSDQLGFAVVISGIAGLLLYTKKHVRYGLAMLAVLMANLYILTSNTFFMKENPDSHGYLMISLFVMTAGSAYFVMRISSYAFANLKKPASILLDSFMALGAILLVTGQLFGHYGDYDRSKDYSASTFSKRIVREVPYGSVLFTGSYASFANLSNVIFDERYRQDIILAYTGFLENRGYSADLVRGHPELSAVVGNGGFAFGEALMKKLDGEGIVPFVELSIGGGPKNFRLRYEREILEGLSAQGWFFRSGGTGRYDLADGWREFWKDIVTDYRESGDYEFKKNILLAMYLQSLWLLEGGRKDEATWLLGVGRGLEPDFDGFVGLDKIIGTTAPAR